MNPLVRIVPLFALGFLTACFMSETPRIETGTLLGDGPVVFCSPDDDCQTGRIEGDGYVVASDNQDEEDTRLRFEPLVEAGGVQVYLGEAELRDEDSSAWSYLVARSVTDTADGRPRFDIIMPGCNDFDDTVRAQYGLVRSDSYSCVVDDLDAFRSYLTDNYSEKFANPAWWSDED
jgi:hypothetical protein